MSELPDDYAWLPKVNPPLMVQHALELIGFTETPQPGNHVDPVIKGWATEAGIDCGDEREPWCGLFMGLMAHRSDKEFPSEPMWALNWEKFGVPVDQPMLGDVLVLTRNGGGHVTMYVAEDDDAFHCLGGNQSRSVCITRIAKDRNPAFRRPHYNVQPDSVKPYRVEANGELGASED